MPYCFVPLCQGGSKCQRQFYKDNDLPKLHFFQPPDEEARLKWEVMIKRKDVNTGKRMRLEQNHKICSAHFQENDIILFDEYTVNGEVHRIPRERATLKPGASPVLFKNYPKYYQPTVKQRKSPAKRKPTKPTEESAASVTDDEPQMLQSAELIQPQPLVTKEVEKDVDMSVQEQLTTTNDDAWNHLKVASLALPVNWVLCNTLDTERKILAHINPATFQIDKKITFEGAAQPEIVFRGIIKIKGKIHVTDLKSALKLMNSVDQMRVCTGTGEKGKAFSNHCSGAVGQCGKRCTMCNNERERLRKKEKRQEVMKKRLVQKKSKQKVRLQILKRSKINLTNKILQYKKKVKEVMMECSKKKTEILEGEIKNLPQAQQEAVRACFDASKRKGPSGRRYKIEWIYECMLMRIKSPRLYQHIRDNKILPLPCNSTIRGYLKHYSGAYGFNPDTLRLMKEKGEDIEVPKKRGVILIDEVKLTPGAHFNRETLKYDGFVDFGPEDLTEFGEDLQEQFEEAVKNLASDPRLSQKRTKKNAKNKNKKDKNLGDHGLVITFQPLQGNWVQNLGCFLTKDAANDDELTKLILEAVILVEFSGFFVDGVVTDGAAWNRSMWKKFGIDEENVTAQHPCDSDRQLHFFSDYPHLLKCMRNCFLEKKKIETPNGEVKLCHWQAVVTADSLREVGLRECPRLTKDHLNLDNWTKQRCGLAWQFWSSSAAAGMFSFRLQGVEQLADCDASARLCKLINELSDTMNSRTPKDALRPNSKKIEAIDNFLAELTLMEEYLTLKRRTAEAKAEDARIEFCKKNNRKFRPKYADINKRMVWVFSESTDIGLKVTLKGTKKLLEFLCTEEIGYKFLMTSRLNQDALERFFGLMRQSCGANTHPEPHVFAQLFRLLSIYSLVKPLRGSNITGGGLLKTLLNLEDLQNKSLDERKKELDQKLDEIIQAGQDYHHIEDIANIVDHNYIEESIDDFALVYVAGYTARKSSKFTNECQSCETALKISNPDDATDEHLLIKLKTRGYLTFPSNNLVKLLRHLEKCVVATAKNNELEENILFMVVEKLEGEKCIPLVGCEMHSQNLTKAITKFYLIMRMHFLCKRWNEACQEQKKKQRIHRKQAHQT